MTPILLDDLKAKVLPVLQPYVHRITLFGSFARGDQGPGSDIDLLIALKSPKERPMLGLRWFDLEEELSEIVGRKVEMVSESALSPHVRPFVEQNSVILYEEG